MTDQLERELRQLFSADAERAPAVDSLALAARRRAHQQRRSRIGRGTGVLVAASVAGLAVVGGGWLSGPDEPVPAPAAPQPAASQRTGALPDEATASCAVSYSPRTVADRAVAFDGTAIAFGPAHSERPNSATRSVGVTFTVHEWFVGGAGPTVTLDMPRFGYMSDYGPPYYGPGTRLLVSGEHRWGGKTWADVISWGCGFTRYYDRSTADSWRAATR